MRQVRGEVSNKYVAGVAEKSAQQCKEENDMNRLMGKKEDFGGAILYLYVSSTGGYFP